MTDDVDNIYQPKHPEPLEMFRVLQYIASYDKWDFSRVQDPEYWCKDFIAVAKCCLERKRNCI